MTPDQADLSAAVQKRRQKLQPYEMMLKKFEYKNSFSKALEGGNPEVVTALCEELVERGGLYTSLAGRSSEELVKVYDFLIWKVGDHRYGQVLVEVARIVVDIYTGVIGLSAEADAKLHKLQTTIADHIELSTGLLELAG